MSAFKPKHVVVYALWAQDVPATTHFYRDTIGLDLLPQHGHYPAFDLGHGSHLVIVRGQPALEPAAAHRPFPQIAFAVEDLDKAIAHLQTCGVGLEGDAKTSQDTRWVVFRDPAGNLIEFAQFNTID